MGKKLKNGTSLHTLSATNTAILEGVEDLRDWDDEELHRGQRRDKNGHFRGRPPKVVPQEIHEERVRRIMGRAGRLLRESTLDAVVMLRRVVNDEDAPVGYRLQASEMILSRTIPKSLNLAVGVSDEPKFMGIIRAGIVSALPPGDGSDIIDAEVIDDDDIVFEE